MSNPEIEFFEEKEFSEILGHEIRLEHVLRTLGKKTKDLWAVSSTGEVLRNTHYEFGVVLDESGELVHWLLSQPLSGQSPATLDWLEKVVCET